MVAPPNVVAPSSQAHCLVVRMVAVNEFALDELRKMLSEHSTFEGNYTPHQEALLCCVGLDGAMRRF